MSYDGTLSGGPAVQATGLIKEFEKGRRTIWQRLSGAPDKRTTFRAVDGIDLVVERGEIFGLLGPNGAGKTTTMKMLSTLLEPTAGTIHVLGIDVAKEPRKVRARLGAMLSGERSLYWKLTGRENLEYFAALYHVPPAETKARIERSLEAVKLLDRADDYVERYSTGMRQRLALARALLPDPPLVVLDEPTVGLDPQSARPARPCARPRAAGANDPPDDALHGGSRSAVRPDRDHRPRPDRRPRHPGRAQAPHPRRGGRASGDRPEHG